MSKTVTVCSSITLTVACEIGHGIDRVGRPVNANGGIAIGVAATAGLPGETIRVDHGPICEALSGAAIGANDTLVMWNNTGRLVPYAAGAGIRTAGVTAPVGGTAAGAGEMVRFYPLITT